MATTTPKAKPRRRSDPRPKSPLEGVAAPLNADETRDHSAWQERRQALGEPASRVLRFATWYPTVLERWTDQAAALGAWSKDDRWDGGRNESCRRRDDALAHRTGADRLVLHLVVEETDSGTGLVARYCRRGYEPMPPPRYTDDMHLTWDELQAGEPCRGCGRGFFGGPEWKPVKDRTPEEAVAIAAEEAAFQALHPDCQTRPWRWSYGSTGLTHCGVCCPRPPLSPGQAEQIARIMVDASLGAARRDAELEERWSSGA